MTAPLVSVIVCHHLPENRKYLDACLRSLEAQVGVEIEVLLMAGSYSPEGLPLWVKSHRVDPAFRWVHKINAAVPLTHPESKYIMILNDDVILSKYAIATMSRKLGDYGLIMNPMSNCDNSYLYTTPITLGRGDVYNNYIERKPLNKRFYTYTELEGWEDAIINHTPGPDVVIPVRYVCFYATMIPRAVWNAVGTLDEGCYSSHDDEDYCMRAAKMGITSVVDLESFIFHFGGRTSSVIDTDEERARTLSHFTRKWQSDGAEAKDGLRTG